MNIDKHSEIINRFFNDELKKNNSHYFLGWQFKFELVQPRFKGGYNISFAYAVFHKKVDFSNTHFHEKVDFSYAVFYEEVTFSKATFLRDADFSHAQFKKGCSFSSCHFQGNATFCTAQFNGVSSFSAATFLEAINFQETISQELWFQNAKFFSHGNFHLSTATNLDFSEADIQKGLDFSRSWFDGDLTFRFRKIGGPVRFHYCTFIEGSLTASNCYISSLHASSMVCVSSHLEFYTCKFDNISLPNTEFIDSSMSFYRDTRCMGECDFSVMKIMIFSKMYFAQSVFEKYVYFDKSIIDSCSFSNVFFKDKLDFVDCIFPIPLVRGSDIIMIDFDYSTFSNRVRFKGNSSKPLELGTVSFKGVDLSNVEFHNVKWIEKKEMFIFSILNQKINSFIKELRPSLKLSLHLRNKLKLRVTDHFKSLINIPLHRLNKQSSLQKFSLLFQLV